eukprot:g36104.t1
MGSGDTRQKIFSRHAPPLLQEPFVFTKVFLSIQRECYFGSSASSLWQSDCPAWTASSNSGCGWTQNGAICFNGAGSYSDDSSECWCACCCGYIAAGDTCGFEGGGSSGGSGGSSGGSCAASTNWPAALSLEPADVDNSGFATAHGKLRVLGVQMVDKNDLSVQLMGMSSHGLHWFPNCYSKQAIAFLVQHWGINLFRTALFVKNGGYDSNPGLLEVVKNIVAWCEELGIYVLIDYHTIANLYKDKSHVLYEIANEPNGVSWSTVLTYHNQVSWSTVLTYHNQVISAIRAVDPHTIIIWGTTAWSQGIDEASLTQVAKPHNVMYAFHFYAGTHSFLYNRVVAASSKIPLFVTEWGVSEASGDGAVRLDVAYSFLELFKKAGASANFAGQKISFAQWSYADKSERTLQPRPTRP